jgi:hypothetical protein
MLKQKFWTDCHKCRHVKKTCLKLFGHFFHGFSAPKREGEKSKVEP